MKSLFKVCWALFAFPLVIGMSAYGQEQNAAQGPEGPWLLSVRAGGQFSDNRDGLKNHKESNLDLFIEPRADYRLRNGDRTTLDLAVLPMLKWHSNPRTAEEGAPQHDTELFGTAAMELMHQLSERFTVSLGDAITYNDDPQISNGGTSVRESNNHIWNLLHAGVDGEITETVSAGAKGSYSLKRYSDSTVAADQDEDIYDSQLYMKDKLGSGYGILGFVGYSDFKNKSTTIARGSSVISAGAGVEKTFSPDFFGKVTAGYQHGEYDSSDLSGIDTPNGTAELTFRKASDTRFHVGGSYGLYAPYVRPYSIQTLTAITGGIDHDIVNSLTVSLNGQYGRGKYKSEGATLPGGNDDMIMVGVSATYRLNQNWSVWGGYTYENWDSDVRESFDRNMVDLGVKAQL